MGCLTGLLWPLAQLAQFGSFISSVRWWNWKNGLPLRCQTSGNRDCVCVCFIYIYVCVCFIIYICVCVLYNIYSTWYIWPSAHPYVWKYVGTLEIASDDKTLLQVASPRLQGSMSEAKAVLAARPVAGGAWDNSITSFGQHLSQHQNDRHMDFQQSTAIDSSNPLCLRLSLSCPRPQWNQDRSNRSHRSRWRWSGLGANRQGVSNFLQPRVVCLKRNWPKKKN